MNSPASIRYLLLAAIAFMPALTHASDAKISITDTINERLKREGQGAEKYYFVVPKGSFSSRGRATKLSENTTSQLGTGAIVDLRFGEWVFSGPIGLLPTNRKSAKFVLPGGGMVRVSWSKTALTWSVTAKTGSKATGEEHEASPVAAALAGNETYTIKATDFSGTYFLSVSKSPDAGGTSILSAEGQIPFSGKAKYAVKKVGRGDLAEEYGLNQVSVKGSAVLAVEETSGSGGGDGDASGGDGSGSDDGVDEDPEGGL